MATEEAVEAIRRQIVEAGVEVRRLRADTSGEGNAEAAAEAEEVPLAPWQHHGVKTVEQLGN